MRDKFPNMQDAWSYLLEHDTDNDTIFIGVIKCKKDENQFTRIMDIGIRSYNEWD